MSASATSGFMAPTDRPRTVPGMRRYPASFLVMSAVLASGSMICGVIQQNTWLYAAAAVFAAAGGVYAVLRRRAAAPAAE
jgi:hypothetical protein